MQSLLRDQTEEWEAAGTRGQTVAERVERHKTMTSKIKRVLFSQNSKKYRCHTSVEAERHFTLHKEEMGFYTEQCGFRTIIEKLLFFSFKKNDFLKKNHTLLSYFRLSFRRSDRLTKKT